MSSGIQKKGTAVKKFACGASLYVVYYYEIITLIINRRASCTRILSARRRI